MAHAMKCNIKAAAPRKNAGRAMAMAMPRAKATAAANGEVWVEKVDRIRFVYNAITKPSVYVNPRAPTVTRRPVADFGISREKIDDYIARKKKQFAQEA
ncbi:hypothetical protein D1007_32249 [Hordeum vulgare]|uniref:uncharacterized protein LOC123407152 n=1 Tax=Hordeum vulgare subsp. vulgare TaxID=112509 RepID=UPI001D1A3639|nr:uncharacterized protein LOC123407152 [Hordeum vulgare subsp. vulgare]KAE8793147.1 hypothetical protein D1007_32249 [Hordeum vulgare]